MIDPTNQFEYSINDNDYNKFLQNFNSKEGKSGSPSIESTEYKSAGESESFQLRIREIEAEDKDKERNTPKIVRWFGTGDTLKAVIIWSIAMLLAIALLIAMVSQSSEMVKAIIPALSTTVGFLVGSRA